MIKKIILTPLLIVFGTILTGSVMIMTSSAELITPYAIVPPILAAMGIYTFYGTLIPQLAPTMFKTPFGAVGRIKQAPRDMTGKRLKWLVAFESRYVDPDNPNIVSTNPLTRTTMVEVTDSPDMFITTPTEDCEAPEGCVTYLKKLSGVAPANGVYDAELASRLEALKSRLAKATVLAESAYREAETMSKQKTLDMIESTRWASKIADMNKRIFFITRGSGTEGSGFDALENIEGGGKHG